MKQKFENRLLTGGLKIACKYDDGTVRYWEDLKENVVDRINSIVTQYARMGYRLTLRQLHYQFVGHDPKYVNHQSAYKKLGLILDDCRYGGVVDWSAIVDRGRQPKLDYNVTGISGALSDTHEQYKLNRQEGQATHIEIWSEKDALSEILQQSSSKYHLNLCINKGYTSSSAIYSAYQRFKDCIFFDQEIVILYVGDHDPSGLDMVRDVEDRLKFMLRTYSEKLTVIPICLTHAQVKKYKLPPNPTKITDSRSEKYIEVYGKTCWEVDALNPEVLTKILEDNIEVRIDIDLYEEQLHQEGVDKKELKKLIDDYEDR